MKLWCPLTPPINESDVFIDNDEAITSYLYDTEPIPESLLPPVFYAKRGDKRIKLDSSSSASPSKYIELFTRYFPFIYIYELFYS